MGIESNLKCDHVIGIMNDPGGYEFVRLSEREKVTDTILREYKEWRKYGIKALVEAHDKWTRERHFDETVIRFTYCPDCGVKNDL